MTTANSSFDRVASTTLKNYAAKMADNVSNHIPFLGVLKQKGAMKEKGGDTLVLPLMHGFANAQSYSGSDVIDITKQSGISAAEYNWKQTVCPAIIEGIEDARNSGPQKQEDLMEQVITQAEISLENKVSQMLFGDGTGNSGKDMLGLEAIIAQDPTTGTLGGINGATNSFWRNTYNTSVGSFATNGVGAIQTAIRSTQRGTDSTDLIVTGSTIFGYMQAKAQNQVYIQQNQKLANLGFNALTVEGVDVIHDLNCPADRIYGINTRWLKFYIHPSYNFKTGKFIEPANQDILVAKILLYAQLATNRREAHWVLSGVTA